MKYQSLGRTGIQVSSLCFGTMSFGGDADPSTAAALFDACRDAGVNFFDCADVYSEGGAEEILGALIAPCRHEVVITSKAYFPTGDDPNARGSSRYHLVRAVEASLKRLGTDYLDLYFLHRFDDTVPLEESLRSLELLVQQGKILHPAVSNFAAWQAAKALGISYHQGWAPIACLQPMYNLAKRQAEVEILPLAQSEGLGVMPYSPLGGGLLSGKYGLDLQPTQGRLLENAMYAVRYGDRLNYEIADRFSHLAREVGREPAALAIAWVAAHPAVTAPIVGARTLDQLATCLDAADIHLEAELYQRIADLSPTPPPATDRNDERVRAKKDGLQLENQYDLKEIE